MIKQVAVVLYGSNFWKKVINFDFMIETGVISREDLDYFTYADSVEEAFQVLTAHLSRYLKK